MMAKRKTVVDEIFETVIAFGGLPVRRSTAVALMRDDGFDNKSIDAFVFGYARVMQGAPPVSYEDFKAISDSFRVAA